MSSFYPKLVLSLAHAHDAWLVGSAADPENLLPRDYDMVVPYSEWQKACMLIPKDAKPNTFGGWKCTCNGVEVDVWPGELGWIMQRPRTKYALHIASGVLLKKQ